MPYRFDLRDPTLTQALRRIAGAEIAAIRTLLDGAPDDAAVHGIRKRIKKLRALLRLLRGGLRKVQPAETVVLRDAARLLAPQRDAAVRLATLDRLLTADDGPALRALRAHLEAEAHAALPGADNPATPPDLATLRAAIDSLALRAEGWSLHGADRRVLTEGLAQTRERARAAMRLARDRHSAESLHAWRKRVKDHWYQARLLSPVWPEMMKSIVTESDRLAESLGLHHDLHVLTLHLEALPEDILRPEARDALLPRIAEAQTGIEAAAFPLGARLFAGDPDEMAALWVKWWKLWRAQMA